MGRNTRGIAAAFPVATQVLHGRDQMLLRNGLQQGAPSAAQRHSLAFQPCRTARRATQRKLVVQPAATAAPAADSAAKKAPRKYAPRKAKEEEQQTQQKEPELPVPLDYQQTVIRSFTIGGVGLHSGEYAVIRVRPAFAGEGRYFVRVPEGTNKGRFAYDGGSLKETISPEEAMAAQEPQADEDLEDLRVDWFEVYLQAQEERGFEGSFRTFLDLQVQLGELDRETFGRILGLTAADYDGPDLPAGMGPEPDMSMVEEEVVPLDPNDPTVVTAAINNVVHIDLPYTQLSDGDTRVMNVELLLSALEACGVDNARIEIEGGHEIPVLDNSALGWCIEIQVAGMRPAPIRFSDEVPDGQTAVVQRDVIMPSKAIAVQDDEGWITFFPGPFPKVTFGVDHRLVAPVIGEMWYTWHSDEQHFRYSLAPARAYVESIQQLFDLRDRGLLKAGSENLFNIAHGEAWWDPDMLRMVYDEPARYRLAQLVGNLSLLSVTGCQGIPVGHVTAHNAAPSLQLAFVRAILESIEQEDVVSVNAAMQAQEEWLQQRAGAFARNSSMSQGPPPDLADGSPAVIEAADVEVMDPDEEV